MARWMQRLLVNWWPLITVTAWGILFGSVVFVAVLMADLAKSMKLLAGQLDAVREFSVLVENNLNRMQISVKETEIHLQAHSQRMGIIEKRINGLESLTKRKINTKNKETEHILLREYILVEPPTPTDPKPVTPTDPKPVTPIK